jgi:hypothetical protein
VSSIYDFVAEQRDNYRSDTVQITDGYGFSQYETLRTIELYDSDRFLSGNKDSLGREKPFYNICTFRKNVATRATDLDTKDVQIQSDRITKTSYAESFLLNLKNRNWMKQSSFAPFLNRLGQTRCKYGGVMVKKTEIDDELEPELDLRDFGRDGVDGRERPAREVGHRFRGIDALGAGRPVDRERVAAERRALMAYVRDFGFDRAATVAQDDFASFGEALIAG